MAEIKSLTGAGWLKDKVATSDAALSIADGVLTVGDGTTYNTVENNVISWIVF